MLCAQTNMMKREAWVLWLLEASDIASAVKRVDFAWCFFQNVEFKLPLIISAYTIYDALLFGLQFFYSADNLALVIPALSADAGGIACRHDFEREEAIPGTLFHFFLGSAL
jgi:hypothetical protein